MRKEEKQYQNKELDSSLPKFSQLNDENFTTPLIIHISLDELLRYEKINACYCSAN